MNAIYEPRGMAREYSPRACNLYKGCEHGCTYCYAPAATFTDRDQFAAGTTLREGIMDALAKDARKYGADCPRVLFCFTSDPYQPNLNAPTRDALTICQRHGVPVQILTKGGIRACRDFDIMARMDAWFGTTLAWTADEDRAAWEPNAATVEDRIAAIEQAAALGIPTWVSAEPVIDPKQVIDLIRYGLPVDYWKVGKWNHDRRAVDIDWNTFAVSAVKALEETGRSYYIKDELAKHLPQSYRRQLETDEWRSATSKLTIPTLF